MALPNLLTKEKVTAHIALRLQPSPETHAEGWTLPPLRCGAGRTRPGQASGAGGAFPAPSPGVYLRRAAVEKNCLFHTPLKKEKKEKKDKKKYKHKKVGFFSICFPNTPIVFVLKASFVFKCAGAVTAPGNDGKSGPGTTGERSGGRAGGEQGVRCAGPAGSWRGLLKHSSRAWGSRRAVVAGRGTGSPAAAALPPHSALRRLWELLPFTIGSRILRVRYEFQWYCEKMIRKEGWDMSWCCGQRRGVRRTSRQETRRAASGHFVTPCTVTALLLRRLRSVPRGGSCTRSALEPGVTPCPATAGSPSAPSILSLLAFPPLSLFLSPSRPVTRFPAPSCWAARADRYHLGSSGPTRRFPAALRGPPAVVSGDAARPRTCPFHAKRPSSSRVFCVMWSPLGRSLASLGAGTVLVGAKRVQGRER